MPILRWFPWKQLVSRVARAKGLVDPIKVLSRLESFGQPLEVKEPLELLRAGLVFHARGVLNTSAIQHNLDWIWPYWVERQYDPLDESFIPRSFSITHVNLTHRNWTAVGLPGVDELPIVDPRGLTTPFWDSWSLDAWVHDGVGAWLLPSRAPTVEQRTVCCTDGDAAAWAVVTECSDRGMQLASRVAVEPHDGSPRLVLRLTGLVLPKAGMLPGWLVLGLRPYNPEGVSFVNQVVMEEDHRGWKIDKRYRVRFTDPVDRHRFSDYRSGDLYARLPAGGSRHHVRCPVGMATAAALFRLEPGVPRTVEVTVPLCDRPRGAHHRAATSWPEALAGACRLSVPHARHRFLYDAAVRSLVLHSPGRDVYPGPYTYRRFWFRDASFILHALACVGRFDRVERALESFPDRQTRGGFFLSQEGEWDSNGEALWILHRTSELSGRPPRRGWRRMIEAGGDWILHKRVGGHRESLHAGLLPAGFSAEHLGPNDYYYWDDFWGVAGLRAGAALLDSLGRGATAARFRAGGDDLLEAIETSAARVAQRLDRPGLPASPYRRLDSGAIGSIVASYPLRLSAPDDPRVMDAARFLWDECRIHGGFFLDVIHSGINPYLTLHLAQVHLRAGDAESVERWCSLVRAVADLASPTGQWPEAVHPRTLGGCMGDGHHVWASAEWVMAIRNAFVREEDGRLVLASGLLPEWLEPGEPLSFGPAPTPWGAVTVEVEPRSDEVAVRWQGEWRGLAPAVEVRPPGCTAVVPHRRSDAAGQALAPRAGPIEERVP